MLSCLSTFIKYNTYLVHLDLRNIGLNESGIKYIASFLTKSQALQCLHLGGNAGVTQEIVNWVCERIKGRMKSQEVSIAPLRKEDQYKMFEDAKHESPIKKGLLRLLRKQTSIE